MIFQADREYLSFQRKSNLPVGESRQGPSGGPGMGPAGEPGTEFLENRQRDSRSTQETGCLWMYRESSYSEWNDGRVREARAPLEGPETIPELQKVVTWAPNQVFEKSESGGRDLEREIAPLLLGSGRTPPKTILSERQLIRCRAHFSEDDWLRHLHNGPIDGAQLFGYSSDLIFRDAALS